MISMVASARGRKLLENLMRLLTAELIIMIVKSSIALSLGLVGALSIVRFRAAIKDPEELTYLFFVIGLGLAGGANQPVLAIVSFVFILLLLFANHRWSGRERFRKEDRMYVNISTDLNDLNQISKILSNTLPYVELKRLDTVDSGLDLSFICKANSLEQVNQIKNEITQLSKATRLSIIDQPDLIV
ncbi:MAG: DUF4956 domain-containing protein, partial [Bacteroidota bacterium]